MYPSFLNVCTFVYTLSFNLLFSHQLAVPKNFPVWNINTANAFHPPVEILFQYLNNQIVPKGESDLCEYSVLINISSSHSTRFMTTDAIFMLALTTGGPRTVSNGIYYTRKNKRLQLHEIYRLHYTSFCRIVLGEDHQVSKLEDTPKVFSDSDVFGTFYVLLSTSQELHSNKLKLNDIFQKLRNILFLSFNHLNNTEVELAFPEIFITSFNWNKLPLISTSDPGMPFHVEYHRRTGKWTHFILAAYHYVALKMNATNDHVYIYASPRLKAFENGIWDSYIKPLVFKQAHISVVRIRENDIDSHYVYHTVPVYFDHFTFIAAVSRDLGSNAFFANFNDLLMILGVVISTTFGICLIKLLEKVLSVNLNIYNLLFNSSSQCAIELAINILGVFQTVLKPILDQPMLSQATQKCVGLLGPRYIVYTLWLVMVMTMSNIYKCNFVSEIVSPNFEYMPDTFESLVNLKFKTKAVFFKDNMDQKFAGAPNPVNDALLKQTEECNFMDPKV